jgi:hypothetical protein
MTRHYLDLFHGLRSIHEQSCAYFVGPRCARSNDKLNKVLWDRNYHCLDDFEETGGASVFKEARKSYKVLHGDSSCNVKTN